MSSSKMVRNVVLGMLALFVGWVLVGHFFFFDTTVLRSVSINTWQCVECEFADSDGMQLVSIKKVAFQANYSVYRKPKGIMTWPDGGIPLYFKVESRPFILDMESQTIQPLQKSLDWHSGFDTLRSFRKDEPSALIDALSQRRSVSADDFAASPLFTLQDPKTGKTMTVHVDQLGFQWWIPTSLPLPGFTVMPPKY